MTRKGLDVVILLDENMNFYKAQLHCHSTNSDGELDVEAQKKLFKEHGYSVVAFTDHEHLVDNSYLDDEGFLTITSCEVAIKEDFHQSTLMNRCMKAVHLNFYAMDQHNVVTPCYSPVYDRYTNNAIRKLTRFEGEYTRVYSSVGINEMIRIAKEKGFLVSYNHPNWSLENATDYLQYEGLDFIEIYNHSCSISGEDSYDIKAFDDILRSGKKIYATMCDDSHRRSAMFGGWVMINAPKLDYQTIMTCLANGAFYCSNGPEIHSLVCDGNTVCVRTSGAKKIALTTKGRRCDAVWGEDVTQAEFSLDPTDGYFRITVVDQYGYAAHTQSYPVDNSNQKESDSFIGGCRWHDSL